MASVFDLKAPDGSPRYHPAGREPETLQLRWHYDELIKFRETAREHLPSIETTEQALAYAEAELLGKEFMLAFDRLRARNQLDGVASPAVHWPITDHHS